METKTENKKRVAWNKGIKRSDEEKIKQKETLMRKYGVTNAFQIPSIKDKLTDIRNTDEWKNKVRETKKLRYGDENYNNFDKCLKTKNERYGNQNYNNMDKNIATKRRNNTFTSSNTEEIFYEFLVDKYGCYDVYRQYKESRYPFCCDFYIKSTDTFIELNLHPCHNFKIYNPNTDTEILNKLIERSMDSKYYAQVIKVWTYSDPLKFQTAKENNLNYIVFYSKEDVFEYMYKNE